MSDHDDRGPLLIEVSQDAHDLLPVSGIQVARRLIGQQHVRLGDNGARNGDALLLAAG